MDWTGGIASGKTAATQYFSRLGIITVDADVIARNIVGKNTEALETLHDHYGEAIIQPNGELDRRRLRDIIFNNPEEKKWLEFYLHPLIRKDIHQQLVMAKSPYVILSAPLLLETDLHTLSHRILVIDCDETQQISRGSQRDNTNGDNIVNIIRQQIKREERLARADDVISNNGTLEALHKSITNYHDQLLKPSKKYRHDIVIA